MSTQTSTPYLLRRVATRAGVGVWHHRGGVLLALAVSVALGAYVALTWSGEGPLSLAQGAGASVAASTDCADTAMAAIASKSPAAVQQAYQCMTPTFQQRVTEQAFVQQIQTQSLPNVNKLARVGDYRGPGNERSCHSRRGPLTPFRWQGRPRQLVLLLVNRRFQFQECAQNPDR